MLSEIKDCEKPKKSTIKFYIDLLIFFPFVLLALSGLIIQINYDIGDIKDTATFLRLNRYEWLLIHKISAVISTIGISIHIFLNIAWIKMVLLKKTYKRFNGNTQITIWLSIIAITSTITGLIPWLFLSKEARHTIIEIHDELGIILTLLFILHLFKHWKWIANKFSDISKR